MIEFFVLPDALALNSLRG